MDDTMQEQADTQIPETEAKQPLHVFEGEVLQKYLEWDRSSVEQIVQVMDLSAQRELICKKLELALLELKSSKEQMWNMLHTAYPDLLRGESYHVDKDPETGAHGVYAGRLTTKKEAKSLQELLHLFEMAVQVKAVVVESDKDAD